MSSIQAALLVGIVVTAMLHVASRAAGAVAGVLWSIACLAYGMHMMQGEARLVFMGTPTPRWLFILFAIATFGYHAWNIGRVVRARARMRRARAAA